MLTQEKRPDLERGIGRVTHTLLKDGARLTCVSDLVFQGDDAFAVLQWTEEPGEVWPKVKVWLDPARLQHTQPPGWFLYNGDLIDPRQRY